MKKIFLGLTVFFLLLSSPCLAGEWNLTGSLNQGRSQFCSVKLDDGRILVAGGCSSGELSSCEIYDPNTGQWSTTDSMSYSRADFSLTKLNNGKILATAGSSGSIKSEIFDSEAETWSEIATLYYHRNNHRAVLLENGKVLVVGGDSQNNYKGCEIYNPETNEWTLTGFCAYPKTEHTLELLPDGRVMAIAGGNSIFNKVEIYDPATEIWSEIANLSDPRDSHTSHLLPNDNIMVVAGSGRGTGLPEFLSSCEIYDFATEEWTYADSLEIGRTGHCSESLLNNKILAMGGISGQMGTDFTCEIYDYITNQWQTAVSTYYPYSNFCSEILFDERVLAIRSWCERYTWNHTPIVSQPQGVEQAFIGDILTFSVTASDPDNDSIAIRIDWDDGEISDWTECQPSGSTFELSHSWTEPGQYEVRAQSADQWYFLNEQCHNSLSNWTAPVIITITGQATDPSQHTQVRPVQIKIYPNPFNDYTTISFSSQQSLPAEISAQAGTINNQLTIAIFNIKGQLIKTFQGLTLEYVWNGKDDNGKPVPSGIYFCHLENSSYYSTKKILVFR